MIALFTDFGYEGPYLGQMKAVLTERAPHAPVIDLMADAPAFSPNAAAYLLAAVVRHMPEDCIILGVVDPGVGSTREALIVETGQQRFVGPANGLFEIVLRRAARPRQWRIDWRPERLSASFHGRDLFAPVAAMLAGGAMPEAEALGSGEHRFPEWPDDLGQVVYIDGYGNAFTGLRAAALTNETSVKVKGRTLDRRGSFFQAAPGEVFWYENSVGLVEIAANQANAAALLGIEIGTPVTVAT